MDLETTIIDTLHSTNGALTFADVVKGVSERLEPEIRAKLNELAAKGQIKDPRQLGGKNHVWRYQAHPITRRTPSNA